jgi:amino acid permease
MAIEDKVKESNMGQSKEAVTQFEGNDDVPGEARRLPELKRKLKSRHLQMIAIGKNTIPCP